LCGGDKETFKETVFESTESFVPHKILERGDPDPESKREGKQLKVKVRKAYKRRKLGKQFQADLKGLSRQLLAVGGGGDCPYHKTKVNAGQSSTSM
jgi:hypothetical protein